MEPADLSRPAGLGVVSLGIAILLDGLDSFQMSVEVEL